MARPRPDDSRRNRPARWPADSDAEASGGQGRSPARTHDARPELAGALPQHVCANKRHRADRECCRRTVPEVTVDVDGVVVDLDPSRRRRCVRRPLPSDAGSSPKDTRLSEQIRASKHS